jgi:Lanthionine synthetase C-like protein
VTRDRHLELAEAGWRWVLGQVRYDDAGPWIPLSSDVTEPSWDRDGMHSGIGGLVRALVAISAVRAWTPDEASLAVAIGDRLRARVPDETVASWFDGLVSHLETLALLRQPGVDACVERLLGMGPSDWEHRNDATLGTASLVDGGLVAARSGIARGLDLAAYGADLLMAEAEETPAGLNWLFVPRRHVPPEGIDDGRPVEMPNWSHGLAGIAAALARAGTALARPDLVDAARLGAEHLVTLASPESLDEGGLAVPRRIPQKQDMDEYTWNWCHGPAGTLALFEALHDADVASVAGEPPSSWVGRCVHSLRTSGIPERRHPGFWDNDGRCCGTAGVGSAVLAHDREFALSLADTLVDNAHVDGDRAYWRFVEHRNPEPLLPPGVGWMQGAAGIAGFLFEVAAEPRAESPRDVGL